MNIKKMVLCILLLTTLLFSSALAQTVELSARPMDAAQFAHYPSFTREGDRWSVQAIQADALMERFWTTAGRAQLEMCVFHVAVEGNAQTGVWTPVLRFYYMGGAKPINATAVSILADGVRYDLAASSTEIMQDRMSAELITAPMTKEAVEAMQALTEAQQISFRLLGDSMYTAVLGANPQTERGQMEAASLVGIKGGFALLEEVGASSYGLWDLSAAAWESLNGFAPAFSSNEVATRLQGFLIVDDFGMIKVNDRSLAAQAALTILKDHGFLNERTTNTFTQSSSDAVRRAQRYLGLIETGCMDVQLEQALTEGRKSAETSAAQLQQLASTAGVALDRYWFARSVSASANEQELCSVHNTDNVFLAADGFIRNLSARQLHLFMQMQAQVVYNGSVAFTAELVCEGSEGTDLDTLLLPLAQSRLIVYAEIPAYLAQDPEARWTIELTAEGETLSFDLQ